MRTKEMRARLQKSLIEVSQKKFEKFSFEEGLLTYTSNDQRKRNEELSYECNKRRNISEIVIGGQVARALEEGKRR